MFELPVEMNLECVLNSPYSPYCNNLKDKQIFIYYFFIYLILKYIFYIFMSTVKPVLTTTSEQRPPVNNDQPKPHQSNLILIFDEHRLYNDKLRTTATFLSPKSGCCT